MTASATPWPELSRSVRLRARLVFGLGRARRARWVTRVAGAPVEEVGEAAIATGRLSIWVWAVGCVPYATPEADVGTIGDGGAAGGAVNPWASGPGRCGWVSANSATTRGRGRSAGLFTGRATGTTGVAGPDCCC